MRQPGWFFGIDLSTGSLQSGRGSWALTNPSPDPDKRRHRIPASHLGIKRPAYERIRMTNTDQRKPAGNVARMRRHGKWLPRLRGRNTVRPLLPERAWACGAAVLLSRLAD